MEKVEWMLQELQKIYDDSKDYNQRALIKAAQAVIHEQAKRIDQMEGEIDGTLWSPKKWGE
ncbi:MAG: hypothetical protein ACO1OT_13675 [Heyndrickxia sp.]